MAIFDQICKKLFVEHKLKNWEVCFKYNKSFSLEQVCTFQKSSRISSTHQITQSDYIFFSHILCFKLFTKRLGKILNTVYYYNEKAKFSHT